MKKTALFALLMLSVIISIAQPSQYTPMTAQGYQFKRILTDSTLHLPSFCGVPNLRNSTAKNGALALDTCNNRLYKWTNQAGWSIVGGTTIDTTSLSNRINAKIDSIYRSNDSVYYTKNGTAYFAYIDSTGGGGGTSTGVNGLNGTTNIGLGGTITTDTYIDANTAGVESLAIGFQSPLNAIWLQANSISLQYQSPTSDTNLYKPLVIDPSSRIVSNLSYYPMPAVNTIDTTSLSNRINLKVNISDTATMLSPYLRKTDTTGAFLISVSQPNDSTLTFQKGSTQTSYTIRSSIAGSATRLVTSVYNNSGTTIPKGSVIYINGRHSSNLPTIALAQANTEQNSYTTFALTENDITNNSNGIVIQAGNITNLNLPTSTYTDGQVLYLSPTVPGGYTTVKPLAPNHIVKLGTVTRAHPTFGTIELKIENGWQLDELSDVSIPPVPADSVVLQFSRVDSLWHDVSINNAIGTKYIRPSDTSVFQRKSVAAFTFKANNTSSTANATDQVFRDSGTLTYSGTITWTGTTAPSGATSNRYRWCQIGKQVTITISLNYANAGAALTAVRLTLPAGCPNPTNFGTLTAANDIIGSAWAFLGTSTASATTGRVLLQNNAGNNGYEFNISASSGSYRTAGFTLTYFTD